jgi:hypothetical protein
MAKIKQPSQYSWTQPSSDYAAKYPYNQVHETESGHFQEWDDTPGAERIRTQHRTGTFTEIQADGSRVNKIVRDNYEIVEANNNVLIKGVCNITIEGNSIVNIKGDKIERISGNYYQEIQGNFEQFVQKEIKQTSGGDIDVNVGGAVGTYTIRAAGTVDILSDLDVDGGIAGESVFSRGAVTAGTGIHAGVAGSENPVAGISTLGGISAGFPSAFGPGVITATTSVTAPLISGIVVKDVRGPMEAIRLKHNTHIHPTPKGPTGIPTVLM